MNDIASEKSPNNFYFWKVSNVYMEKQFSAIFARDLFPFDFLLVSRRLRPKIARAQWACCASNECVQTDCGSLAHCNANPLNDRSPINSTVADIFFFGLKSNKVISIHVRRALVTLANCIYGFSLGFRSCRMTTIGFLAATWYSRTFRCARPQSQ